MNILLLSPSACYHDLAQRLVKQNHNVFHIGAHRSLTKTDHYTPIARHMDSADSRYFEVSEIPKQNIDMLANYIVDKKIDFVMASALAMPSCQYAHDKLTDMKIPYFFVSPENTILEKDKSVSKKLFNDLGIPTSKGRLIDGEYLFKNFKTLPRPFVVKLNYLFHHGRQTMVVDNHNFEEVFSDLFSFLYKDAVKITNIKLDTSIVLEEYVNIKREYSYHMLVNESGWKFLGSARDYKRYLDNDLGFNCSSMGAYNNTTEVDPRVHEYADKIYQHLVKQNAGYKGFLFLGIAHDETDTPLILEINTRSGDPELPAILGSVTNDLGELFGTASRGDTIPDVTHDDSKTVTIKLANRVYDWVNPASFLPKLNPVPEYITHGLEGFDPPFIKHSLFTTSDVTNEAASKKLYDYLDKQHVGQFRYRRDIGILK